MENKTVIIQGSSRRQGDTNLVVEQLAQNSDFDLVTLADYQIGHFDYNYKNAEDDFIPLLERIVENYTTLVFATPVYWYSMSGLMKVFFDRISDLLHFRKDIGRQLRGKKMAMISISNANDLKDGFNMPFVASADYLGMHYLGDTHIWVADGTINAAALAQLDNFKRRIT